MLHLRNKFFQSAAPPEAFGLNAGCRLCAILFSQRLCRGCRLLIIFAGTNFDIQA